jgi:hypothetical protein
MEKAGNGAIFVPISSYYWSEDLFRTLAFNFAKQNNDRYPLIAA